MPFTDTIVLGKLLALSKNTKDSFPEKIEYFAHEITQASKRDNIGAYFQVKCLNEKHITQI